MEKRRALTTEKVGTGYPKNTTLLYHQMADETISLIWIDGYRADTVKHTEASVWADFKAKSEYHLPLEEKQLTTIHSAEVYNYNISAGKSFDFGDKKWIISKMALTAWSILNSNMTPKRLWIYILKVRYSKRSWKEILFWTIYLLMMTVVPLTNEKTIEAGTKLYFLRNCSVLWWWKRPF
jgi:hypothetical protein